MGINWLWSHIKKNKDSVVSYVDLVEVAKGYPGGMKILVDFYSWEHFILKHFWKSVTHLTQNKHIIFAGGEYSIIDYFIKEFVEQLKAVNIVLVFFLDGAKGSAYVSSKQKMQTWQKRYFEDQDRLRRTVNYLRGVLPLERVDLNHLTRPCLQEVQNVLTLQDCGCTIHLQVSGEADHVIAKHMRDDAAAFAVMSNDTDFCIFQNSVLMSFDYFDIDNDLGLGLGSLKVQLPKKLNCGIISAESVMKLLGLPDNASLIEFAVICGNDFTLPFLSNIPTFKSSYMGQMHKLAGLINSRRVAEHCPFFGPIIAQSSDLQEAVRHSRRFYSLNLEDEEEKDDNLIYNFIAEDVKKGRIPSTIVAMHRGLYWHRQILEDPSPGLPTAELALTQLRAYIYAIILPAHNLHVTEIGRTPDLPVDKTLVRKVSDHRMPNLVTVKASSFYQNLHLFEMIIQHQEIKALSEDASYFKIYGLRMGFICFLLRYFLLMNWGRNLYLSEQEFFIVAAWILGTHDRRYLHLKIVPSPRCVTVENWFLILYRSVYAFLGNILHLSQEFPAPRDLFSGGTWVSLYTACAALDPNPHTREPHPLSVCMEELKQINANVTEIITCNGHAVRNIIRGLFPF